MSYLEYLLIKLQTNTVQILCIVGLTILAYSSIFSNGFAWDDKDTIINWEAKREWGSIPRFIRGETPPLHAGNYRPIRNILYIIDDKLWGVHPFGYHLQSIAIEISASLLLYLISKRITKDPYLPLLTALLFALHPIHTEAITWITSSMDMFGIVWMFLSLYLFIRLSERPRYKIAVACSSLCFAFLAFGTNEVTLTLPGLLFLFDWYFLYPQSTLWNRVGRTLPYAITLALYLCIRLFVAHAGARAGYILASPHIHFLVMLKAYLRYIQVLIFPIGLTIDHNLGHGITSWLVEIERSSFATKRLLFSLSLFSIESFLALFLIIAPIVLAIYYKKSQPVLSFAIAWFFVSFLTTLNIIPTEAIMVERFAFVPSFGFILAAAYVLTHTLPLTASVLSTNKGRVIWGGVICVVGIYAILTFNRNSDWKDDTTLWTKTVEVNPKAILARIYLANQYLAQNDLDAGLYHYQQAFEANPDYPEIQTTLGLLYDAKGDHAKAIALLTRQTDHPLSELERYMLLANAYRQIGKYDLAIASYQSALKISPNETSILNNIGATYALMGNYEQAKESFQKALSIDPNLESAKQNLEKLQLQLR